MTSERMKRETSESELQSALCERYTDFSKVGQGGMAVVYKAHDTVLLRSVAIKTLLIKKMTPDMVTRFQQEARTAGKLQHPNVVTVLDFGMSEQIPYLIMDYADGETLASVIEKKKKLPFEEVVELASEVCRGMAFAHSQGVIHRDLKPSNIVILSQPEADALVKIVDFGIAKIVQSLQGDTASGALTLRHEIDGRISNSQLIGSPFYMSPEQIRGEDIDARSDIYSFGCTLYQMLTGKVPFRGETKLETFNLHLNSPPPAISEPGVPPELALLTLKCLEKEASNRPDSMSVISETLLKCLESSEPADSKDGGHAKWKSLQMISVAAVVVVALFSVAVLTHSQNTKKPTISKRKQKAKIVEKIVDRKWYQDTRLGKTYWIAFPGLTDAQLLPVIENKPKFIDLRQAKISKDGLASLASVPVEELDLNSTSFDDTAAPYLSKLKTIKRLGLSYTKFTDKGLEQLDLPNLVHLDVDCLPITDRGLETIVTRWPRLSYLNISGTPVTSKGLMKLAKLRRIVALEVAAKVLDDDAMKLITSMPLTRLSVNSSKFSKKWLDSLGQMKTLTSLSVSNLHNCTDEDYAKLTASLPNAKVVCINMAKKDDEAEHWLEMMK